MIDLFSYLTEKVYTYVQGPKTKKRNSLNFRCPVCGDSKKNPNKKRGWVTLNQNQRPSYHCWNCGVRMNAFKFIGFLEGVEELDAKKAYWAEGQGNPDDLMKILSGSYQQVEVEEEPEIQSQIEFGDHWIDWEKNNAAKSVVTGRGILNAPFAPDNWRLFYDKKTNRLVIPWIRDGQMTYYQLRSLVKSPQKYLFPPNTQKDIFGLDNIDESFPYVFFTEGVFDAIFIKNCLAIGGIFLTKHQEELIEERTSLIPNRVFFPDNQWFDQTAMDASIKAAKENKPIFIWPKDINAKDVNEHIMKTGKNPFADGDFLIKNTFKGIAAITKLKFRR